jgi:hypothetical protein
MMHGTTNIKFTTKLSFASFPNTLLIASLAEEFMSLLLSSNVITDEMFLSLGFEDSTLLKLTF